MLRTRPSTASRSGSTYGGPVNRSAKAHGRGAAEQPEGCAASSPESGVLRNRERQRARQVRLRPEISGRGAARRVRSKLAGVRRTSQSRAPASPAVRLRPEISGRGAARRVRSKLAGVRRTSQSRAPASPAVRLRPELASRGAARRVRSKLAECVLRNRERQRRQVRLRRISAGGGRRRGTSRDRRPGRRTGSRR